MTTFMDKVSIISELSRGATKKSLAEVFSITEDDVNTIELHHSIIVEVAHYMNISQGMPLRGGYYPQMENILFCWKADRDKVTNRALSQKAREIVDITGERPKFANASAFTGTEGWVRSFKARYENIPINQRQGSSEYDEDVQAEPIPLSTDEIKLELGFEPEPEVIQSQHQGNATVDDGDGVMSPVSLPANSNEIFSSSPEEHMESESLSTQQGEIESSQIDERPMQKRSTATNEGENSPSDTFDESLISGKSSRKRKAASIDEPSTDRSTEFNSDEDSLSQDLDDSAPVKKRRRTSDKILVQTKAGTKTMTFQEYNENKIIRIFKPLLKYAKDSQWTSEDLDILNHLYRKSLRSCGGKQPKQLTITTFFRKKK